MLYKIFHHILIKFILFLLDIPNIIPCKTRVDCPVDMCELSQIVWCIDGSCKCL
ncbi:Nodule Cysteine-Rich (NCR) secreted peptide [Medicago truncatula]|uniref:Nodule Cysteine-Rich (NCR) secreted peptide n=1 Tax=Medicago truncatula TaxID=3880 RepID=A0A072VK25_MEDTR|nr:Nodule Cysteine-Rich (NCR) secreted peptide [Medicago truncatula]